MDGNPEQEAYFASTRGSVRPEFVARNRETLEQRLLRQIRNAVVVIAIAACLPYPIWVVYHLTH
jgi:hypothetical protein